MPTQSQKNSQDIIKLQGELKLVHQKIDTIKNNHLVHMNDKINNIHKTQTPSINTNCDSEAMPLDW